MSTDSVSRERGDREPIPELLRHLSGLPRARLPDVTAALSNARPDQIQWALDAGLGPLLFDATKARQSLLPAVLRDQLRAADLVAQVEQAGRVEVTKGLIRTADQLGIELTLLKGISISDELYRKPHFRPMSDIDVLVPERDQSTLETALQDSGYERAAGHNRTPGLHHGPPLLDPQANVWVEVHSTLFRSSSPLMNGGPFANSNMALQTVESDFHGLRVRRLSAELQLVYLASYWSRDLRRHTIDPSFITPLVDAVTILRASERTFDWEGVLTWPDNPLALASLYLLLSYLAVEELAAVPRSFLQELSTRQRIIGSVERRILLGMIKRHLVAGKRFTPVRSVHIWRRLFDDGAASRKLIGLPWAILFPPHRPANTL